MKIVVIGGTGRIGSKVVAILRESGIRTIAASLDTGVNTLTGDGLAGALTGAAVVVDVSNAPSFEDGPALEFFKTSTQNILTAERAEDVHHHVALSVVGTDRMPESGYMRAKLAQEKLIEESSIPYSIVHATQFFDFVPEIADAATVGGTVRLAPVLFQPIATDDVASAVAEVAVSTPVNGMTAVAGPEEFRLDGLIRRYLEATHDPRPVVADPHARYFGAELEQRTLVPDHATLGTVTFGEWLSHQLARATA